MIRFWIACWLLFVAPLTLAQSGLTQARVESSVEEAVGQVLSRHLRPERYQVIALATLAEGADAKNIMLPGHSRDLSSLDLGIDQVRLLMKSVKIEILIDEKYSPKARTQLAEILKKKLRLRSADSITFSNLNLPIASASLEDELSRSERQLADVSSRLEALKLDNEQKSLKLSEVSQARDAALNGAKPDAISRWSSLFLPAALVFGILVFSILMAKAQGDSSKRLSEAVQQIAKNLPREHERHDRLTIEATGGVRSSPAALSGSSADGPMVQRQRILELQHELDVSFRGEGRTFIIQHVSRLVPLNPTKAVFLLEALGKENASRIYEALNFDSQTAILATIRSMNIDSNKYPMMIETAEELKTLLVVSDMAVVRNSRDTEVSAAISRISDEQLPEVCKALTPDALGRFLHCAAPKSIAMLLKKSTDGKLKDTILKILPDLPHFAGQDKEDPAILRVIASFDTAADREARPYFAFYKELLEVSDDALADEISSSLVEPKLQQYLAHSVVRLSLLFRLPETTFDTILDDLTVKDVAVLMKHCLEDQRARILQSLKGQRSDLVTEEYGFVSEQSLRQTLPRFEILRAKIIEQLKQLQRDGELDDLKVVPSIPGIRAA